MEVTSQRVFTAFQLNHRRGYIWLLCMGLLGCAAIWLLPAANAQTTLRVLQMNLCNSGLAGCYEGGRSINEAYNRITGQRPDIVTLNEICSRDVARLWEAMASVWPGAGRRRCCRQDLCVRTRVEWHYQPELQVRQWR
jgi:hypothetical protein